MNDPINDPPQQQNEEDSGGKGTEEQPEKPPPKRPCPRCDSDNTKFCYFNNYNLMQPRYFCKGCRRYWTHGGILRNVPVGGSSRKAKRQRTASSSAAALPPPPQQLPPVGSPQMLASGSVLAPLIMSAGSGGGGQFSGHGGGFYTSLVAGQMLQGHGFGGIGRPGFHRSYVGGSALAPLLVGGGGSDQFWTVDSALGGIGSSDGAGSAACASPIHWPNFPTGGGDEE